jgi:hypothetical protein
MWHDIKPIYYIMIKLYTKTTLRIQTQLIDLKTDKYCSFHFDFKVYDKEILNWMVYQQDGIVIPSNSSIHQIFIESWIKIIQYIIYLIKLNIIIENDGATYNVYRPYFKVQTPHVVGHCSHVWCVDGEHLPVRFGLYPKEIIFSLRIFIY